MTKMQKRSEKKIFVVLFPVTFVIFNTPFKNGFGWLMSARMCPWEKLISMRMRQSFIKSNRWDAAMNIIFNNIAFLRRCFILKNKFGWSRFCQSIILKIGTCQRQKFLSLLKADIQSKILSFLGCYSELVPLLLNQENSVKMQPYIYIQ